MDETREFTTAAVLSAVMGRLLCEITKVYEVLTFLTGRGVYTHELGVAGELCYPEVLRQHPRLAEIDVSEVTPDNWREKLVQFELVLGQTLSLTPIGWNVFAEKSPLDTLTEIVGDKPVIVFEGGS
jgi:hypothetical protein